MDAVAKESIGGYTEDGARADILIQDNRHRHKSTYLDICVVSGVCDLNNKDKVINTMCKAERRMNID